jgi:hypothetical protein
MSKMVTVPADDGAVAATEFKHMEVQSITAQDAASLERSHASYGDSWKRRGGVGAFMMLARKWDRLENAVTRSGYDVFAAIRGDKRAEGILDDIRDLRRYLVLVEAEFHGQVAEVAKDAPTTKVEGLEANAASGVAALETVYLTAEELAALPEYSTSLPTGVRAGKRWKRQKLFGSPEKGWLIGEYAPASGDIGAEMVVVWYDAVVLTE